MNKENNLLLNIDPELADQFSSPLETPKKEDLSDSLNDLDLDELLTPEDVGEIEKQAELKQIADNDQFDYSHIPDDQIGIYTSEDIGQEDYDKTYMGLDNELGSPDNVSNYRDNSSNEVLDEDSAYSKDNARMSINDYEHSLIKMAIEDISVDNDGYVPINSLIEETTGVNNKVSSVEKVHFFVNKIFEGHDGSEIDSQEAIKKLDLLKGYSFDKPENIKLNTPKVENQKENNEDLNSDKGEAKKILESREKDFEDKTYGKENPYKNQDFRQSSGTGYGGGDYSNGASESSGDIVLRNLDMLKSKLGSFTNPLNFNNKPSFSFKKPENISVENSFDILTEDANNLSKNLRSYNSLDENDPSKEKMKNSINKKLNEFNEKMESSDLSDKNVKKDPEKSKTFGKSLKKLQRNMENVTNKMDFEAIKKLQEKIKAFVEKITRFFTRTKASSFSP